MKIKESDWKVFKQIKEKAIESYSQIALEKFKEVLASKNEAAQNNFFLLHELTNNRIKEFDLIFDGDARSKAPLQLMAIRSQNLADPMLIDQLSEELVNFTNPKRWK